MKTIFLKTIILVLTISFIGCNKEDNNEDNQVSIDSSMKYSMDGETYSFDKCQGRKFIQNKYLDFTTHFDTNNDGVFNNNETKVYIIIQGDYNGVGTYQLAASLKSNFHRGQLKVHDSQVNSLYITDKSGGEGVLVIEEETFAYRDEFGLEFMKVKGHFSFTGIGRNISDKKVISNGSFVAEVSASN